MSVIIEGECRNKTWKGWWYFAKDKEPRREFEYTKSGNSIPKDLLDYVSFVNPNSGDKTKAFAHRFRGGNTIGHKKRGRSKFISRNVAPKLSTADTSGLMPGNPNPEYIGTDVEEDVLAASPVHEKVKESNLENENDILQAHSSRSDSIAPNTSEETKTFPEFIEIDDTHELFGLWEGTFDVAPVEGAKDAHQVKETFFFHSFLGTPPKADLSCLPAEAHYTYSALKAITTPVLPPPLIPESVPSNAPIEEESGITEDKIEGNDIPDDSVLKIIKVERNGEATAESKEAGRDAPQGRGDDDGDTVTHGVDHATTITPGVKDTNLTVAASNTHSYQKPQTAAIENDINAESDAPLVTDGSHPCGLIVMVGFGRNRFGRFSLTATLDPLKHTFIAEKRYMLSKSATLQRKGRKAESLEPGSGPSTRPRTTSLIDVLNLGTQKKKRYSGGSAKRDLGYLYDESYNAGLAAGRSGSKKGNSAGAGPGAPGAYGSIVGGVPEGPQAIDLFQDLPEDAEDPEYKHAIYDEITGEVYEGGWSHGYRHGRGVCLYADGSMYEGSWLRGKEHGRGQLMGGDRKIIYTGEWQEGAMHGHGTYNFYSGDKYVGDFREGARHGKGEFRSRDGCGYIGDWRDNKRCGRGTFSWPNGSYYEGEWDNDTRHGKGKLWLQSGFEYEGSWLNNSFDGRGVAVFPNKQRYEGSYKCGMREGRGSITFAEGAIYEGRFRDDRLDGQGTIKVSSVVPGVENGEKLIPIEIQADIRRIHLKAGFGAAESH